MTNETDFFDGIGGAGAPSPQLSTVDDGVIGEIVEMFKRDYVPYENRKTREPARNEDGSVVQQLVIIVQTEHRNWQNVSKVPKVDPADPNSAEKPPSEDDGKRGIYVPQKKNIQFAIGRAATVAGARLAVGGRLGVKIVELRDTGQGQPLKVHEAIYQPPSAADGFFGGGQQAQSAPPAAQSAPPAQEQQAPPAAQAAPAAPAAQDPWATAQPAASAQGDPWASQAAPAAQKRAPF